MTMRTASVSLCSLALVGLACDDSREQVCPPRGCPDPVLFHSRFDAAPQKVDVTACRNASCATKTLSGGQLGSESADLSVGMMHANCYVVWHEASPRIDIYVSFADQDVQDSDSYRVAVAATGGASIADETVSGPFEVRPLCGGAVCHVLRFGNDPPQ